MKILILILIINSFSIFVFADGKFDKSLESLILQAKVLEAKLDQTDKKYPRVRLKLEVTFTNKGNEPIIILQSIEEFSGFDDLIFSTGVSVFGKNENGNYPIQNYHALPSVCRGCNENLGKILDQKLPPEKYTKILKPKESVTLIENTTFGMPMKTSSGIYGWDEIDKNNWKVEGKISYSMFPTNLGKYGEHFGSKLQKRWEKYGILFAGDSHSAITSEKFEIDLTDLKFQ